MVKLMWKTVWWTLKKVSIELPYDPAISLLDMYLEELKAGTQRDTCTPLFLASLFTIANRWKHPSDEQSVVCPYNGIVFIHIKE